MKKLLTILFIIFLTSALLAEIQPVFNYIVPGWTQPTVQPMDEFWGVFGYQETGDNYWSTGDATDTQYWDRFIPGHKRYQGWFGVYIIDNFEFANEWYGAGLKNNSVQRSIELSIVDQYVWLYSFGIMEPRASLVENSVLVMPWLNGHYMVNYKLNAQSDFGGFYSEEFPVYPDYSTYANSVMSFHDLILHCTILIKYDFEMQKFIMIYSALPQYQLKSGQIIYPKISVMVELYTMMTAVEVRNDL